MKKKISPYLAIFATILLWDTSQAEVIFQDNFDTRPDWEPASPTQCVEGDCSTSVLQGWTYYRSMGHFNTDSSPSGRNTINVSNEHFRGETGKGFTVWTESYTPWSADGLLTVDLGQDYDEIFISCWIQMKPGWQWASNDDGQVKVFRAGHYDRSGNSFSYFSSGSSGPLYIFDLKNSINWGWRHSHSLRCDPQETDYYCGGLYNEENAQYPGLPTFEQHLGDGTWHHLEIQLKTNTGSPGNWNQDGVVRYWYDGVEVWAVTDAWFNRADAPGNGWNTVGIGGNQMNVFTDTTSGDEQWYVLDDVVVSTTRTGVSSAPPTITINSVVE